MKNTNWLIIRIGATGVKTSGGSEYKSHEIACEMMTILEQQNPYTGFLLYTVDEWEQEKALYGWR